MSTLVDFILSQLKSDFTLTLNDLSQSQPQSLKDEHEISTFLNSLFTFQTHSTHKLIQTICKNIKCFGEILQSDVAAKASSVVQEVVQTIQAELEKTPWEEEEKEVREKQTEWCEDEQDEIERLLA